MAENTAEGKIRERMSKLEIGELVQVEVPTLAELPSRSAQFIVAAYAGPLHMAYGGAIRGCAYFFVTDRREDVEGNERYAGYKIGRADLAKLVPNLLQGSEKLVGEFREVSANKNGDDFERGLYQKLKSAFDAAKKRRSPEK